MDSRFTVGVSGDSESNIDLAKLRDLAKELILDPQILGTTLQAPANLFLVLRRSNALHEIGEPTAAHFRRALVFSGRIHHARGSLLGDGVALNAGFNVGDEEEEGEEGHGEEDALHG